jgi:HK97 gp10 family phage protein
MSWERGLKKFAEQAGKKALSDFSMDVEKNAKINAPVKTGALRDSIKTKMKINGMSSRIGSDLDYALYVEVGTKKMSPRAYLRKALNRALNNFSRRK